MKPLNRENKKDKPEHFFETVFSLLPIMAEEGTLQQATTLSEIDSQLSVKLGCSREEAAGRRLNWQRLLQAFCLLDERALDQGQWRFVSFPASLFARSLVSGLAIPEQTFFPHNYWEQGAHRPTEVVEEQRQLLHSLESRRLQFHPQTEQVLPIRVVHVAWGLLRLSTKHHMSD